MKIAPEVQQTLLLAGIGLALAWYIKRQGGAAIDKAGEVVSTKLNPASDQNIVYSGVNGVVSSLAGRETTLGYLAGDVQESISNTINDLSAAIAGLYSSVPNQVKPASHENLIYQGANDGISSVLGYETSVGGAIFDGVEWLKDLFGQGDEP